MIEESVAVTIAAAIRRRAATRQTFRTFRSAQSAPTISTAAASTRRRTTRRIPSTIASGTHSRGTPTTLTAPSLSFFRPSAGSRPTATRLSRNALVEVVAVGEVALSARGSATALAKGPAGVMSQRGMMKQQLQLRRAPRITTLRLNSL